MTAYTATQSRVNYPPAFGTMAARLLREGYTWTPPCDVHPQEREAARGAWCPNCTITGTITFEEFKRPFGYHGIRLCHWCGHYDELKAL